MLEALLTKPDSPPEEPTPGQAYGGGFYVGKIQTGGQIYALVLAPRNSGRTQLAWSLDPGYVTNATSLDDGWSNTQVMMSISPSQFPAANFCRNLDINGYTDWYLPSINEVEMCYRAFKPDTTLNSTDSYGPYSSNGYNPSSIPIGAPYTTTDPAVTTLTDFLGSSGSEALDGILLWSSTEYTSGIEAYRVRILNGQQGILSKGLARYVRAVRRIPI